MRLKEQDRALASPILRLSGQAVLARCSDVSLLFVERDQELHRLEGSSAFLAARLVEGTTAAALAADLRASGICPSVACQWTEDFLRELARIGVLSADIPPSPSAYSLLFEIDGLNVAISFSSQELLATYGAPYAHLPITDGSPDLVFEVDEWNEFVLVRRGGGEARLVEHPLAAIQLKGMILDEVLSSAQHLAALHSACLLKRGRAVLLLGSPGAGKTTLSMALLDQGYTYGADDVTLLQADGTVAGVPLAPSLKESGWTFADDLRPDLMLEKVHLRPDGQRVRFARLSPLPLSRPVGADAIVRLRREDRASTRLTPIEPQEALQSLICESRSGSGRCSVEAMHALLALVGDAHCLDIHYSDARDAALKLSSRLDDG